MVVVLDWESRAGEKFTVRGLSNERSKLAAIQLLMVHEVLHVAGHTPFAAPLSHSSPASTTPFPQRDVTLIVTASDVEPDTLVHVSVYVCEATSAPVACVRDVPVHPPGATEQEAAFAHGLAGDPHHVSVADEPDGILIGPSSPFALISAAGRGGGTVSVT